MHSTIRRTSLEGYTASINGMQMYFEVFGDGEPLLLLHGFFQCNRFREPFFSDLAKHYQLIAPDLRGHGRSTNPSNQFTHGQAARDLFALLDQLGIDTFKGIGHSSGGMTLIHMATQQPERVEAMIPVGATFYFPEQAREFMRQTEADRWPADYWEMLRERHKHGDDQIRALAKQFHGFHKDCDDMNFTVNELSTITARTLIVHGDRDQFFPVSIPVEMYGAIPHAYLWIMPNGGHGPIQDKNSAEFTRAVLEFFDGEWET